ncbi:uncharacterized protein LOC144610609 isoform X1 [Rhinoraja longicauda]
MNELSSNGHPFLCGAASCWGMVPQVPVSLPYFTQDWDQLRRTMTELSLKGLPLLQGTFMLLHALSFKALKAYVSYSAISCYTPGWRDCHMRCVSCVVKTWIRPQNAQSQQKSREKIKGLKLGTRRQVTPDIAFQLGARKSSDRGTIGRETGCGFEERREAEKEQGGDEEAPGRRDGGSESGQAAQEQGGHEGAAADGVGGAAGRAATQEPRGHEALPRDGVGGASGRPAAQEPRADQGPAAAGVPGATPGAAAQELGADQSAAAGGDRGGARAQAASQLGRHQEAAGAGDPGAAQEEAAQELGGHQEPAAAEERGREGGHAVQDMGGNEAVHPAGHAGGQGQGQALPPAGGQGAGGGSSGGTPPQQGAAQVLLPARHGGPQMKRDAGFLNLVQ